MNSIPALMIGLLSVAQLDPLVHVGSLQESLRSPARIAIAADGTVLVTDPFSHRIVRFDATGTLLGTWDVSAGPIGVAVHPDGRYFVSLRDEPKVAVFDSNFLPLGFLGDGNPLVTFVRPTDIDIAADTGRIYVVDAGGDRVYGFEGNGDVATIFGMRGETAGSFQYPSAIAVDESSGRLAVADHDNYRIQLFSMAGLPRSSFGYRMKYLNNGGQEGWMPRSLGVAFDGSGHIYVADAMMSTVRVFDQATGEDLGKVVEYGSLPGDLRTPTDLAVSNDGLRLYVVSTNTSSVEIYQTPVFMSRASDTTPNDDTNGGSARPPGTNQITFDSWRDVEVAGADWLRVTGMLKKGRGSFAMRSGEASESGGGPAAASRSEYEGPHMVTDDSLSYCWRCHALTGQPGDDVGLVEGQGVLCRSCHNTAGQAMMAPTQERDLADPYGTNPKAADGRGRSHAWGVSAVNASADSVGPKAGGVMERYLDGGLIKCSTCHNQHNNSAGVPYLRVNNDGDAMCKECHAARDKGPGEGGSHPVGFDYPGGVGEFPADAAVSPLSLKEGNVECMTCHAPHDADSGGANGGEGDGMLLRAANDETLCRTCHADHVGHTPAGAWQPTCRDCHDVHDPSNPNLSLVARTVHKQTVPVADKTVVFTAREGGNSFDDGDPAANDGICQVCHQDTNYHRHDGTGAPHNDGTDCTTCHPHNAGFMPTGGDCTSCHASPQDNGDGIPIGGRRAVVGEFPVDDLHAHYGAALDNSACTTCHDQTTHMDGNVDLIDADSGALYTFVRPALIPSDPDVSDFCASCHDADGATRLGANALDPFGNGNAPPEVATRFQGSLQWNEWYGDFCFGEEGTRRAVNSHHDISDADQAFSGAKIECLDCHGAHSAAAAQPIADPFSPNSAVPWSGTTNAFCLECHWGGFGPTDPGLPANVLGPTIPLRGLDNCDHQDAPWHVDYAWAHVTHGPDSKRGWEAYSGAPESEVECTACHDPHGSFTPTNPLGNPYAIRDFVDGSTYVDDGVRPGAQWTGPPWDTMGASRDVVVSISGTTVDWGGTTGLCSVCHADWLAAMSFHDMCTGCQSCHGHGQAWGNADWGTGAADDTPCPFNNNCGNASALALATPAVGNTESADADALPVCGPDAPDRGIWYSVTGTGNTMTVTTCLPGTNFDTTLQVYCNCAGTTCVGGNDDDASCGLAMTRSTVSWCSQLGQVYYVQVGGAGGAFGTVEIEVTDDGSVCGAPIDCGAPIAPIVGIAGPKPSTTSTGAGVSKPLLHLHEAGSIERLRRSMQQQGGD